MGFILEQAKNIGMTAIIIVCALGGTVGILKLIKRFSPGKDFPKDPVAKKLEEAGQRKNEPTTEYGEGK